MVDKEYISDVRKAINEVVSERNNLQKGNASKESPESLRKKMKEFCEKHHVSILGEKRYNRLRAGSKKHPSSRVYRRVFGSWKKACECIFGFTNGDFPENLKEKHGVLTDSFYSGLDSASLVKLMNEYRITTFLKYIECRKKYPDIFPAIGWITKNLGSFTNLLLTCKKMSINEEMGKLVNLRMSGNKAIRSEKEIEKAGINIKMLKRRFGGFRKVMTLSSEMAVALEIKKRNNRKDNSVS